MENYRAYLVDTSGHIIYRKDMLCADDDDAKRQAKVLVDGQDVELWHLDRRIATFKAGEK